MLNRYFQNKTIVLIGVYSVVGRVFLRRLLYHTSPSLKITILETEKDAKIRLSLLSDPYFPEGQRLSLPSRLSFISLNEVESCPHIDYLFNLHLQKDFSQGQKAILSNILLTEQITKHLTSVRISTIILMSSIYAHAPGYISQETVISEAPMPHPPPNDRVRIMEANTDILRWRLNIKYMQECYCAVGERVDIVRVGMVGPTLNDQQGYCVKFNVFTQLCYEVGRGKIKSIYGRKNNKVDVIPADYLANYLVMVAVKHTKQDHPYNINTYNLTTSTRNPLTLTNLLSYNSSSWFAHERHYSTPFILEHPYTRRLSTLSSIGPKLASRLGRWLDVPSWRIESKQSNISSKMHEASKHHFSYYLDNEWTTPSHHSIDIHHHLTQQEERTFMFNVNEINWEQYLLIAVRGIKKYLLHQHVESYRPASLDLLARGDSYFSDVMWAFREGKVVKALRSKEYVERVMHSKGVKDVIRSIVDRQMVKLENRPLSYQKAEEEMNEMTRSICVEMFSDYHMGSIRAFAWFLHKVFRTIYEKVVIDKDALMRLKQQSVPFIIIPTHRSYIDFLIMSYIFFGHGLRCPHIAAAQDFLSMALVHLLLRRSGAFFIKRNQQKHKELYSAIMREYVSALLIDNHSLQFFIEGTRSRAGKMLAPKLGMLKIVVENVVQGRIADAIILPVCINYEKVLEGDSFTYEMMGESKVKESLGRLLKAVDVLKENYGRIYIQMCQGLSVKKYFQEREQRPFGQVLVQLGNRIVYTLGENSVITTPAVVATTVLMHRKGISDESLNTGVMAIINQLNLRKVKVSSSQSDSSLNISSTLSLLSDVLNKSKKDMFEVELSFDQSSFKKLFTLVYYRNTLSHIFFQQALLYTAITTFGHESILTPTISLEEIYPRVQFLRSLLGNEYYLQHMLQSRERIQAVINKSSILLLSPQITMQDGFYMNMCCSLVWPVVESYWITALYMLKIKSMSMSTLLKEIQWFAQTLITQHILSFGEAISSDTIKNAVQVYIKMGYMQTNANGVRIVKSDKEIKGLIEQIGIYLKSNYAKSVKSILEGSIHLDFPFLAKL